MPIFSPQLRAPQGQKPICLFLAILGVTSYIKRVKKRDFDEIVHFNTFNSKITTKNLDGALVWRPGNTIHQFLRFPNFFRSFTGAILLPNWRKNRRFLQNQSVCLNKFSTYLLKTHFYGIPRSLMIQRERNLNILVHGGCIIKDLLHKLCINCA